MPTVIGGDGGKAREVSDDDPIFNDPLCKGVPRDVIRQFLEIWAIYPTRRGGNPRRMALKAFLARLKAKDATVEQLAAATANYRKYCEDAGACGTPYVLHGATFYGPNERWKDFLAPQPDRESDELANEIRETWVRGGSNKGER